MKELIFNYQIAHAWGFSINGLLVLSLLLIYQLKHFLCDFPLQTEYMLGKFKADWGFLKPLSAHAGVHALATFLIALAFNCGGLSLSLALFDFVVHFSMDRLKAGPKYLGRFKPLTSSEYQTAKSVLSSTSGWFGETKKEKAQLRSNKLFWISLGVDQLVHHVTHYAIIAVIVINNILK